MTRNGDPEALKEDVQVQCGKESVKEQKGNKGGKELLKGEKEDLKHVKCGRCNVEA